MDESEKSLPLLTLRGQRVSVRGRLEGVSRRELQNAIRTHGGELVPWGSPADILVVDSNDQDDHASSEAGAPTAEVLTERELWNRLGMVNGDAQDGSYFTAGMLARLVNVSPSIIRRWLRNKMLVPHHAVFKVAYFSFQELTVAKRLAALLQQGISLNALERTQAELARLIPETSRPLTDLSYVVEGKQLLFRAHGALVDSIGQLRFDFESLEQEADCQSHTDPAWAETCWAPPPDAEALIRRAHWLEDHDQLSAAVDAYRAALAAKGADTELNFQLADLLYRLGDVSAARERYYVAIELDENFVEARKNLGCVLLETGEREFAMAAFQGALSVYPDYADVHFHLAQVLDDVGRPDEAAYHRQRYRELAPNSPWAEAFVPSNQ